MSEYIWRIYRYYNPIEDKSYIGQTTMNVKDRARKGNGYSKGTHFRDAIDKYGFDTFEQSILRLCTSQEEADTYEKFYIEKYDSINNGYNTQSGGCYCNRLNAEVSEESRKKMSTAKIGKYNGENNPMFGRHHLEESRKKMSEKHWNCSGEHAVWFNKHLTEEHKKKLSEQKKGRHWYNDGINSVMTYECPEGFVKGRLKCELKDN